MKWTRFLLLLFLIPNLIYASSYSSKEYEKDVKKISSEWKRHEELLQQFNRLKLEEKEQNIGLLRESIACCQRGIKYCNRILRKIGKKSKSDQKEWKNKKEAAKQDKSHLNIESGHLQALINNTLQEVAFSKAVPLYQESEKKANLAELKNKDCVRRLNNVEEVVSVLNEVSKLYEEALFLAREALNLISPYPDEESKNVLRRAIENYGTAANKHKKEASDWPASVTTQKNTLKEQVAALEADSQLFIDKGLKRSSYELQKQAALILEQLIESSSNEEADGFKEEMGQLKVAIAAFEKEAEISRLTEIAPLLSNEDFMAREKERRELFFKNDLALNPELFLQSILPTKSRPFALPLDGSIAKKGGQFTLYAEQFYRFLIQSDDPVSELVVTVYKKDELIHEEIIALPLKNTPSWERYLVVDGMTFIPETKLKTDFGLDLRLSFVCDPRCNFSMIIAQKCSLQDYQFSFSLKDKSSLYVCDLLQPPPWQLGFLRKPASGSIDRPIDKKPFSLTSVLNNEPGKQLENSFPILDQFVDQLKKDPLALVAYVHNEIEPDNRISYQGEGIFHALGIQRNAFMTFLEKRGSPWEQCQLLVYLLRKAGYPSLYVTGTTCSLPKTFLEKLLLTKLPSEQTEGLVNYPWVIFFDGKEWVSLFPWMKEMQVHEGHDLYNLMPEEYASADRWILRYLKEDERILKHIGSDKDDTLGVLFKGFVNEELTKHGLSLSDVGLHQVQIKKQFSSWSDFPRPLTQGTPEILDVLNKDSTLFDKAQIEIFSHENPQKKISQILCLADLNCSSIPLRFTTDGNNRERLYAHMIGQEKNHHYIDLDASDRVIDIRVLYQHFIGPFPSHLTRTISIEKGTEAALCFHLGGSSPKVTSQFYEQFSTEKEESKRLYALLAFVGAAYFEKCGHAEKMLSSLHKTYPVVDFAFGLTKFSTSPTRGKEDLKAPQVDMMWCFSPPPFPDSTFYQQEVYSALRSLHSLLTVDSSSNEHQILLDVFGVKEAVSTVKLLQLANRQQQKKGLPEPGFLTLTPSTMTEAENTPEAAAGLYFPQLKDLDLRQVKATPCGQWDFTKKSFMQGTEFDAYAYAYMTPGLIFSSEGAYKEMGTLFFHPLMQGGLISSNNLLLNGGLGSPLPSYYFAPSAINTWQLVPSYNTNTFGYTLYVPPSLNTSSSSPNFKPSPPLLPVEKISPGTHQCSSDIRLEHKPLANRIGDPVDVVTGSFYIDEVDLSLPGPFPLEIRRNYNSQNPLIGDLGIGWKLSLNPSLIKQDGKLYAAEADGTVIAYSYNRETSRWEVFPEDNPDLYNLRQNGIGSTSNPFHAYIESDILYGSDGSKRIFEDGLLKKWINSRGNVLEFFYNNDKLSRIESSNGDFCGLLYNHEGKISEIYAKDGRRISYHYNSQDDLVKVTLPNSAVITYEYDHSHRIIRETKPHGKVLENVYKEGKVQEQHSPMGPQQQMIISAKFDYQDGVTIVTDAKEGTTTYKIFEKQIYKIIDPLGYETLQAWFIDEGSCFDPETERVIPWEQPGGAARSLQASTDKRGLTTYYLYDSRGNPIEIGLKGNDLTGSGEPCFAKKLIYNDQDLCIQEEILDQKTKITYDKAFPYLPKRIEKYSGNILLSYIDLEYNSHGLVEKEDQSGSITLWEYDNRSFPRQKTQVTGTDDPDVITIYSYNHQGQCIQIVSADGVQESDYDIMGNPIQSLVMSPSGILLSATYIGYNLNNEPIWKQTANSKNTLYIDYHASGAIKASRQALSPTKAVAYTLYEYNSRGYLVQEVDPMGYTIYRDHDAIGNVICETKEGLSTLFTYEPGSLPETITSPSGAKTTRLYTTNGLLKEEVYPDGTRSSIVYDHSGRPVLETKNNISWEIKYDDLHARVIRTQLATKTSEIREFDARGNLIRFTDAAGYTSEKTYDGLNRIKTETTPSGEQTVWNYQDDTVICSLPNGEQHIDRYEGGRVAESKVVDARGTIIASSSYHYDPETDVKEVIQGKEVTTSWMNALGLPIKIQKGHLTTTYEYDLRGNCISVTDGDGRITRQAFDGLGRITQKELPDGSTIEYAYDLDSNLSEYHLPNGSVWKASYDTMGRKVLEELQAGSQSSLRWEYAYEDGYLKEAKDPMQRVHVYQYEPSGRLSQETVDGGSRTYTYDPRGLIATAEETRDSVSSWLSNWVYGSNAEHSLVERSYDPDGHLSLETIYLNSNLVQQTKQAWDASSRSLQIGSHTRDFIYQNSRLVQVSVGSIDLSYAYDLSGSLKGKSTPWSTTVIGYNAAGLPENIQTRLPDGNIQESLEWYASGKLFSYSSPMQQKKFAYTNRGYLQAAGGERYDFDFGIPGTGVRTAAPSWVIPQNGLDAFGKILTEIVDKSSTMTTYNPMGEVITHNQRQLDWDPWGRLIKVSDGESIWEASYDAFGRRLQTHYTSGWNATLITTSFYDPEEEFQEIGIKYGDKTFWKIYGPNSCDAVADETGASVVLVYNALDQLAGVVSRQETVYSEQFPSSYGPQSTNLSIPSDVLSYAQSLTWHSQAQDPTGLIWMGKRYYDPRGGKFLSPDSIGYPICLDLYAYAGGDPVNYLDPDGRFISHFYQSIDPVVIGAGGLQILGGFTEAGSGIFRGIAGIPAILHGLDNMATGLMQVCTSKPCETLTFQYLQKMNLSPQTASWAEWGLGMGSSALTKAGKGCSFLGSLFRNPVEKQLLSLEPKAIQQCLNEWTRNAGGIGGRITSNYRKNLIRYTGFDPGKVAEAHHVLPQVHRGQFLNAGINIDDPKYLVWMEKKLHRAISKDYTKDWKEFFRKNNNPDRNQILQMGKQTMSEIGIPVNY